MIVPTFSPLEADLKIGTHAWEDEKLGALVSLASGSCKRFPQDVNGHPKLPLTCVVRFVGKHNCILIAKFATSFATMWGLRSRDGSSSEDVWGGSKSTFIG